MATPRALVIFDIQLSLGELELPACAALAVFLSFLHAAIAGQESGTSQSGFET
jgi:hypothetical protein